MTSINTIREAIIASSKETKIYLGSDSKVLNVDGPDITFRVATVAILHINGNNGCKVLGFNSVRKVQDSNKSKPFARMLAETYETLELYQAITDCIDGRHLELHLDINPNESHGSSVAVKAASGIIQGVTMIKPKLKPHAFAASCAADRMALTS